MLTIRLFRKLTTGHHATNDRQRLKVHLPSSFEGGSFLDEHRGIPRQSEGGLDHLDLQGNIYVTMTKSLFCRLRIRYNGPMVCRFDDSTISTALLPAAPIDLHRCHQALREELGCQNPVVTLKTQRVV